jgi:hypothetical protein
MYFTYNVPIAFSNLTIHNASNSKMCQLYNLVTVSMKLLFLCDVISFYFIWLSFIMLSVLPIQHSLLQKCISAIAPHLHVLRSVKSSKIQRLANQYLSSLTSKNEKHPQRSRDRWYMETTLFRNGGNKVRQENGCVFNLYFKRLNFLF